MSSKKLRDFYMEYFNGHMFRDIDYIRGKWKQFKDTDPKDSTDRLRYNVKNLTADANSVIRFKKSARYFLVNKKHRDGLGQLVHHNSYFKTIPDFHSVNTADRMYDRLFFDIDKHDDTIDGFKHKIADIKARQIGSDIGYTYKQKLRDIEAVQKLYREYILHDNDGDFLADPFNDAMKVTKFFNDRGTEPVLISTSGAGFHLNVFFNPVHLQNPSDVFLSYTNMIGDKTGVPVGDDSMGSNLDLSPPKNAVIGTQRTPYSVHEKSGLYGFIIPSDWSYDDYMTQLEKNKLQVHDFSYDDHLVPELLREQIIKMDSLAGQKKEQKKEQYKQKRSRPAGKGTPLYLDGKLVGYASHVSDGNSLSSDLRTLWDLMVTDGMCEPVQDKDVREHYNRVRCPFPDHEDKNPSAICGKYRFKCFKCCPDGINWYMLIAVTYGIIDPDDIKKNPTEQQKQDIKKVIHKLQGISPDE